MRGLVSESFIKLLDQRTNLKTTMLKLFLFSVDQSLSEGTSDFIMPTTSLSSRSHRVIWGKAREQNGRTLCEGSFARLLVLVEMLLGSLSSAAGLVPTRGGGGEQRA